MAGAPAHLEHAQPARDCVAFENLQGDDERVRHEIAVHASVEDLDRAVVRGRGEERVGRMEVQGADRTGVVSGVFGEERERRKGRR